MKIIVLNYYSRNSLAIVNALGGDYELIGGAVRRPGYFITRPDRFFKSPGIREIFRHADPKLDGEAFKDDLVEACRRYEADGIIASGTTITNYLSRYKQAIEDATDTRVMVEDYEKLGRLTDKWSTFQLARSLGVDAPPTVLLEEGVDNAGGLAGLRFPVVLKPRVSYAAIGINFFDALPDLMAYVEGANEHGRSLIDGSYIVQEKIEGELCDVTGCAQRGRAVSALSQRRLMTLYDFGGGGIVNITTREEAPIVAAKAIMAEAEWNGAIEFDFICDPAGKYFLLECNPKIWGTTYLTVMAGMNVVRQTAEIFLHDREVPEVESYEEGLLYRWLFPECVFNWIQKPRTVANLKRRLGETFTRKGARRTMSNLRLRDMPHLIGVVFDRAQL